MWLSVCVNGVVMVVWLKTVEEMKLIFCTGLYFTNNGVSGHFIDTVNYLTMHLIHMDDNTRSYEYCVLFFTVNSIIFSSENYSKHTSEVSVI